MFDIPFMGQNSTSVTLNPNVGDLEDYYDKQAGKNHSLSQEATSSDGIIKASTTYDFLNGQHPIPGMTGTGSNKGYFYQSVITFWETDLKTINDIPDAPSAIGAPRCSHQGHANGELDYARHDDKRRHQEMGYHGKNHVENSRGHE